MALALALFAARDETRYWLRIAITAYPTYPPGFDVPVRGVGFPSEYCREVWCKKLELCGYPMVKNCDDTIIRFDRIHERDGETDGRTPHDGIGCAYA